MGKNTFERTQSSGVPAAQIRTLPAFAAVELAGAAAVSVHVGGRQSVVVHADANLIARVATAVEARTLVVGTRGSFQTKSPLRVDVTVPALTAVTLSGDGVVAVTGIASRRLVVHVPGNGVLAVTGTVDRLVADLTGSGDVQLQHLVARDVDASISGAGRLQVVATRSLAASVSGAGVVVYGGDPEHVTTRVTGTGAVVRG